MVKWSEINGFREIEEESRRLLYGLSIWRRHWLSCRDRMLVENWRCRSYELLQSFLLLYVSGVGRHVELAALVAWDLRFWGRVCWGFSFLGVLGRVDWYTAGHCLTLNMEALRSFETSPTASWHGVLSQKLWCSKLFFVKRSDSSPKYTSDTKRIGCSPSFVVALLSWWARAG
jgi:hypothetical protein